MITKWKQAALLLAILFFGYMPILYGTLSGWPHFAWSRFLFGPIAVLASAVLVGVATTRFSRWWLLAVIAPLVGMIALLTASI